MIAFCRLPLTRGGYAWVNVDLVEVVTTGPGGDPDARVRMRSGLILDVVGTDRETVEALAYAAREAVDPMVRVD